MAEIDNLMARRVRALHAAENGETNDNPDDEDEEFGLYYPLWYVFDTWIEHDEHGLYPQSGGYDDQSWHLMQDWKTLDRRYGKAYRERHNAGGSGGDIMDTLGRYTRKTETDMRRFIE